MVNVLALIRRLPALDRRAFREHYEERHVVVARPLLRHLVRYARHHVETDLHGPVDFDVITAFGYPDESAIEGMFATLASEAAGPILEDEKRFMDKPGNRFFQVSERPWSSDGDAPGGAIAGLAGEEEDFSTFVLVARPPAMSRAECAARLLRDHWPSLLADGKDVRAVRLRDAFAMRGVTPPFDGVLQFAGGERVDVGRFAKEREREGYRVVAVRTRRFVTPLPVA